MVHRASSLVQIGSYMVRIGSYMNHIECCTVHIGYYMVHVDSYMDHTGSCVPWSDGLWAMAGDPAVGRWIFDGYLSSSISISSS